MVNDDQVADSSGRKPFSLQKILCATQVAQVMMSSPDRMIWRELQHILPSVPAPDEIMVVDVQCQPVS